MLQRSSDKGGVGGCAHFLEAGGEEALQGLCIEFQRHREGPESYGDRARWDLRTELMTHSINGFFSAGATTAAVQCSLRQAQAAAMTAALKGVASSWS